MGLARQLVACCFLPLVLASTGASPVHAQVGLDDWRTIAGGNEILALEPDPFDADVLWVGTEGGGLLRWDLSTGRYEQSLFPQTPGLLSNDVYDIAFDEAGDPWLATAEGVTHARQTGGWLEYTTVEGLPEPWVRAVAVDSAGTVWAGTGSGLARLEPGAADFEWVEAVDFEPEPDEPLEGPGASSVLDLAADDEGRLYVAHGRGGNAAQPALSVYDGASESWEHIAETGVGSSDPGPPTEKVMTLDLGPDGRLWMGTWSHGVVAWDLDADWQVWRGSGGPCSNYVWAIDARQPVGGAAVEVWAACGSSTGAGEGVARFDGESWHSWQLVQDPPSPEDGITKSLPNDVITAIAPAAGSIVLGTNGTGDKRPGGTSGSGLVRLFEDSGAAGGYRVEETLTTGLDLPFSNDITALAFEDDGTLWAGTRGEGLMRRAPTSGDWTRYTYEGSGQRLAGDTISALALRRAADGTPELWVGAVASIWDARAREYADGGVSVLNLATGNWDYVLRPPDLPGRDIGSLSVSEDGRVWIGFGLANGEPGEGPHSGAGLIAFDPEANRYDAHRFAEGADDALPGDTVTALAARGGSVWAGTAYNNDVGADLLRMGGGVAVYEATGWLAWRGGELGFQSFHGSGVPGDKDAYITGDVRSVTLDGAGDAWVGTYDLESGDVVNDWPYVDAVVNRQLRSGSLDWESWSFPGSGWVSALAEDSLGRIWAATTRGHFDGETAMTEHSPSGSRSRDTAVGGAYLLDGNEWIELTPLSSGLAANAITALAWDPTTGHMWVGLENGGLSVNTAGQAILPTPTVGGPTSPPAQTATPRPTPNPPSPVPQPTATRDAGASGKPIETLEPRQDEDDDDDRGAGGSEDEPQPPSEVPEAGTWLLMVVGLAGLMLWLRSRQRPLAV